MQVNNNAKFIFTEELIEAALLNLLKRKRYDGFSIKDLCIEAGINRSTFYVHYQDINDLMIKYEAKLSRQLQQIWQPVNMVTGFDKSTFISFFSFVKEHKIFYQAFLKSHTPSFVADEMIKKIMKLFKEISMHKNLKYTDAEMNYHLHFFGGGLKSICGRWIQNDCLESPEQMAKIIFDEYTNRE